MNLLEFFKQYHKVGVAFSGGVDSAYLLYEAAFAGANVKAYFVKSMFQPEFEQKDAQKTADYLGIPLEILELDVLKDDNVSSNPQDRCYYCKKIIMSAIIEKARADGYEYVLDGTNATDNLDDRPGAKALHKLGVLSPLRLCGIGKPEIRRRAEYAGLEVWDKPAYACLATRIPAGTKITSDMLSRIEGAESVLFEMKFSDFRVRWKDGSARLQFPEEQLEKAHSCRTEIERRLKPYFSKILFPYEKR